MTKQNVNIFKTILDTSANKIYVVDVETRNIVYCNRAFKDMFSPDSDPVGKKCYKVLCNSDGPCAICPKADAIRESVYDHNFNGMEITAHERAITVDGKDYKVCTVSTPTIQAEPEEVFFKKQSVETALMSCVQAIIADGGLKSGAVAVERFLKIICSYYDGERAFMYHGRNAKGELKFAGEWKKYGKESTTVNFALDDSACVALSHYSGVGVIPIDAEQSIALKAVTSEVTGDILLESIVLDGKIYGFIGISNPRINRKDKLFLQAIAFFVLSELERLKMVEQLEYFSWVDGLTGTYNRNKYNERLEGFRNQPPKSLGIAFVDINGLKTINDSYGHERGDDIIRKTAQHIKSIFTDDVYRVGGDEFIILCPEWNKEEFVKKTEQLRFTADADEVNISIGTSWDEAAVDPDKQVLYADEQMYSNKQLIKNGYVADDTQSYAANVRRRIEAGDFIVALQPKFGITTNELIGAEALVRCKGELGEVLNPDEFLFDLERNNAISLIDFFVLESVCGYIKSWIDAGIEPVRISINVSCDTFVNTSFVHKAIETVKHYGVPANLIAFELNENTAMLKNSLMESIVNEMRQAGFYIILDKLGSRYSVLDLISRIRFDEIKFDRNLISNLTVRNDVRTMIKHIVAVFNEMDCTALAVGVETDEQRAILKEFGCPAAQGFCYSRAITPILFRDKYLKKPETKTGLLDRFRNRHKK